MGTIASFELGVAMAMGKPIYAANPLDYEVMEVYDLEMRQTLDELVVVKNPEEAVEDFCTSQ